MSHLSLTMVVHVINYIFLLVKPNIKNYKYIQSVRFMKLLNLNTFVKYCTLFITLTKVLQWI